MLRTYQRFLRLYPRDHREDFGEEMAGVFCELRAEAAAKRPLPRMRFYVREGMGLMLGAMQEHWREFFTRRFSMRNEFRFPKATWILMTIILAGVALAIEKGEAISATFARLDPAAGPIYLPGQHTLLSGLVFLFLIMHGLGLLAWAVLFALRRSNAGTK